MITPNAVSDSEPQNTIEAVDRLTELSESLQHRLSPLRAKNVIWSELLVLLVLDRDRREGVSSTMSDVARRVGLSRGAMTPSTDRLEAKLLVQRRPGATDRRVTTLHATGFGTALLADAFEFDAVSAEAAELVAKRNAVAA